MNEKINLKEFTHLLAEKSGIQKKEAEVFLRECFDTIDEALFEDQLVKVKGLGSFKLTSVNDRESVDVVTKKRVLIPAHYKVTYSPDNDLAQTVNEPFSFFETVEVHGDEEASECGIISDDCCEIMKPEKEPKQIIKQSVPVEKKSSNRVFVFCCIITLLLGAGVYYYLSNDMMDIPTPISSSNLAMENNNTVEKDTTREDTIQNFRKGEHIVPSSEVIGSKKTEEGNQSDKPKEINKDTTTEKTVDIVVELAINDSNTSSGKKRTIQSGERLTLIALEEYGDKSFWIYIYEENKSIIKNPNNVSLGLTITIPSASKYGIDKNDEESVRKAEELAKQYKK